MRKLPLLSTRRKSSASSPTHTRVPAAPAGTARSRGIREGQLRFNLRGQRSTRRKRLSPPRLAAWVRVFRGQAARAQILAAKAERPVSQSVLATRVTPRGEPDYHDYGSGYLCSESTSEQPLSSQQEGREESAPGCSRPVRVKPSSSSLGTDAPAARPFGLAYTWPRGTQGDKDASARAGVDHHHPHSRKKACPRAPLAGCLSLFAGCLSLFRRPGFRLYSSARSRRRGGAGGVGGVGLVCWRRSLASLTAIASIAP